MESCGLEGCRQGSKGVCLLQGYVEELAVCLVAVEKDTEGKSMDRLKRLTTELVWIPFLHPQLYPTNPDPNQPLTQAAWPCHHVGWSPTCPTCMCTCCSTGGSRSRQVTWQQLAGFYEYTCSVPEASSGPAQAAWSALSMEGMQSIGLWYMY